MAGVDTESGRLKARVTLLEKTLHEKNHEINALKYKEAQYKDILANMHEAVERNLPDFEVSYVNQAFCNFYGVTEEEVLHTNAMDWVLPQYHERIRRVSDRTTPEQPEYHYTCEIRKMNGDIAWIEVFRRSFFDQEGNLLEYQDVSRDITEYKKAASTADKQREWMEEKVRLRTLELSDLNEELKETNAYLQSTLNNISEGVISFDEEGQTKFLNYGSNTAWHTQEDAITQKIKKDVAQKSSLLYRLLHKNEGFQNVEMDFPSAKGTIQCLASGVRLSGDSEALEGKVLRRGLLVLRPSAEVRRLVNRMSGAQARYDFEDIVGESDTMIELKQFARRVANSEGSVLIEGESGTGKELFAQAIHNNSPRKQGPFVAINCGAIPRDLIGSELFGYSEGSFTGAKKGGKPGKFELADHGTIFLDEIGDMPLEQQIALLRVIQERVVTRVGGERAIPVDVRIICAANKDLLFEISEGNFRKDLYYRLNVINLQIPPLRERKEDIPLLFQHFLHQLTKGRAEKAYDAEIMDVLSHYEWPGNVRELQNLTERLCFISADHPISLESLPDVLKTASQPTTWSSSTRKSGEHTIADLRNQVLSQREAEERDKIMLLMEKYHYNISRIAKEMGISRPTLYRKIHKYRIH